MRTVWIVVGVHLLLSAVVSLFMNLEAGKISSESETAIASLYRHEETLRSTLLALLL